MLHMAMLVVKSDKNHQNNAILSCRKIFDFTKKNFLMTFSFRKKQFFILLTNVNGGTPRTEPRLDSFETLIHILLKFQILVSPFQVSLNYLIFCEPL